MTNYFLTSKITGLTVGVVQELNNPNKHTIREYEDIIKNPIAAACCKLKALRATISLGDYQHENKDIQEFILENFNNMQGNLPDIVGRLCSAMPFGFSAGEIAFKPYKSFRKVRYKLQGINILDPKRVQFAGKCGDVTHVKYNDGIKEVWVEYDRIIHVANGLITSYNERSVYGDPECEIAFPYIKLYNLILSEMAVSAKTLATGILVGLVDSDHTVYLYDSYGNVRKNPQTGQPLAINAAQALSEQFKQLENHNFMVTDKRNTVTAMQVPAGEQFWNLALNLLKNDIMLAFVTPSMVFSEGSGAMGVASLSARHLSILDATVEAIVKQVRDQLIEKVVRPLIIFNFGSQRSYGDFKITSNSDPNAESMLVSNLMSALSMGLIAQTDLSAINVLREKLKLPPTSPQEQQQQAQLQQMMQAQQQPPEESAPYPQAV